ncbi:MAG: hypothetical protein PHU31_02560 [Anaerotignum sp.]|nr:hypothetical protein [Anaerotignum sp.]
MLASAKVDFCPCDDMGQELFDANIDLAYFILHKYFPWYANDEDAKQICLIGL